jgi:topoisomerase-4 subunit A
MRYTEVRMTRAAEALLEDIDLDTVDFQPNYDSQDEEPVVIPARIPNLLVNGSSGIAVGMATNIPPHNLGEVVDGCLAYIANPDIGIEQLVDIVPGPDFPTAGEIITPPAELLKIYETGNGSLRQRACYEVEQGEIIITALPYQVSGERLMEQIAAQFNAKKLPMIEDFRDESDHEFPTRLVIVPRSLSVLWPIP